MEPTDLIEAIEKNGDLTEVHHITTYEGYRKLPGGGEQLVTVKVMDAGPDAGKLRYHCIATGENGKAASGNSAESIETVLATMHWYKLDG